MNVLTTAILEEFDFSLSVRSLFQIIHVSKPLASVFRIKSFVFGFYFIIILPVGAYSAQNLSVILMYEYMCFFHISFYIFMILSIHSQMHEKYFNNSNKLL